MNIQFISCGNYLILAERLHVLSEKKARRILLHAPDGLKHLYPCVARYLESQGYRDIIYSLSPGYGACDIPVEEAQVIGADLIVHLGHERYQLEDSQLGLEVLYVPAYLDIEPRRELLEELRKHLFSNGYTKISVSSTLIDRMVKDRIVSYLVENGIRVHDVDKPVLGCFYSHVAALDDLVDAHLVVAGGLFHPLGLALVSGKPVVAIDPYMAKIWYPREEAERIIKKRLYNVIKAKNSVSMGLITGTRPGQHRQGLVEVLRKHALSKGFRVYVLAAGYLTHDRLIAIDNALNLDFYVVTSCPRLPIDDLGNFHKPVLTPGEFMMIISELDRYIFPW